MNATVRNALNLSILKWIKIAEGTEVDNSRDNCELCKLFGSRCEHEEFGTCPVYKKTEQFGCSGTPYYDFNNVANEFFPRRAITKKQKEVAMKEANFLKSLLQE